METKKNPKVNLENYRSIFLLFGIFLSLVAVLVTFNQSKADVKVGVIEGNTNLSIDEDMVIPTKPKEVTPPEPPKVNVNQDIIEVVKNDVKIIDIFTFVEDPKDPDPFIDISEEDPFADPFKDEVLVVAPVPPVSTIGEEGMREFIAKNIVYPELAIENGVEGTVYVRFVVTKTGDVGAIEVFNSEQIDDLLEQEAIRVIKILPKFKPGYNQGRPVNVWMTVPIVFDLN